MSNSPHARPAHRNSGATPVNEGPDKKDVVAEKGKNEAADLKNQAAGSGERVLDTAKDKAAEVKDEATQQAQNLFGQLKEDVQGYVGPQQERVAATVRSISDEINALSKGEKPQSSYVTGLLGSVSGQVDSLASSLENKDPQALLGDVRRFAARRPGTFLALAAGIGLLAGRATRGVKDSDDVATDKQGVKEYFGAADPAERTEHTARTERHAPTATAPRTSTGGDTYAMNAPSDPARTYTDRVPGTTYPDQEDNRR
ncbi:hypothetical protein [Kocuria tytonicola]|uniref:hypothetical protein n=1 Tax=Kocuria tytonicola TaxID=2055946 RepID=UPI000F52512E|nr:hypothetical protein [Kocuria tytonicola]